MFVYLTTAAVSDHTFETNLSITKSFTTKVKFENLLKV